MSDEDNQEDILTLPCGCEIDVDLLRHIRGVVNVPADLMVFVYLAIKCLSADSEEEITEYMTKIGELFDAATAEDMEVMALGMIHATNALTKKNEEQIRASITAEADDPKREVDAKYDLAAFDIEGETKQ